MDKVPKPVCTTNCIRIAIPECEECGRSHIITRHVAHLFVVRSRGDCDRERGVELHPLLTTPPPEPV